MVRMEPQRRPGGRLALGVAGAVSLMGAQAWLTCSRTTGLTKATRRPRAASRVCPAAWSNAGRVPSRPSSARHVFFGCAASLGIWASSRARGWTLARRARGGAVDYYEVLGVSQHANEKEVKTAFRRLARQYHPDVNQDPDAESVFENISKAYKVLSDASQRRTYDRTVRDFSSDGLDDDGEDLRNVRVDDVLDDVFSDFFKGKPNGASQSKQKAAVGPQRGDDLQCEVELPFDVCCFGGERPIQVQRRERCKHCRSTGIKTGFEKSYRCRTCNGAGTVAQVVESPLGVMQMNSLCPNCHGNGIDILATCTHCRGRGAVHEVKEVFVKIPAGIDNGVQLKISKEGDKGFRGGPSGDLYVSVKVQPSPDFRRDGNDIYSDAGITIFDAMLGASVNVPTLNGEEVIKVQEGTQPDTVVKLKGKGVPLLGKHGLRGDHFITLKVQVPSLSNTEQRELVQKLQQAL